MRTVFASVVVGLVAASMACGASDPAATGDGGASGNGSTTGGTSAGAGGASAGTGGTSAGAGGTSAGSTGGATTGATASDGGALPPRKRGMAYGYHSDADLSALSAGIGWWYNWTTKPDTTLSKPPTNVEYVPMVWGGTFDAATLATQVPANAKYLLTFNEPNFGAQSHLTPAEAAALWPKIEAFAKSRNLKIVSPALNYCGGDCNETNPFDWMDKFFAACKDCQVDYVAAHWYACSKSALEGYLKQYETKYKKPLWLTEFACLDDATITEAKETQYMKDAVALLEADPMVFRYSWFTGRFKGQPAINTLGAASGALTPLGTQYVTLPAAQ